MEYEMAHVMAETPNEHEVDGQRQGDRAHGHVHAALAVLASLVAACALLPAAGTSPAPSEAATPSPAGLSSPAPSLATSTPLVTPTAAASSTPAPSPEESGLDDADKAHSNTFWESLVAVGGLYNFEYESLNDITADVDLIIMGRIESVYRAPEKTGPEEFDYIWATVAVEDVLKGEPVTRTPGTVEVLLWPSGPWKRVSENVPSESALFFLMNEAAHLLRRGETIRDPEWAQYVYWRPNDQAVLRDFGGRISVIARDEVIDEWGADRFPLPLDGRPFDQIVSQVAALAD